jgi:hypothetical protein
LRDALKRVPTPARDSIVANLQTLATNYPNVREQFKGFSAANYYGRTISDLEELDKALRAAMIAIHGCEQATIVKLAGKFALEGVPFHLHDWITQLGMVAAAVNHEQEILNTAPGVVVTGAPRMKQGRLRRGRPTDDARYTLACAVAYVFIKHGANPTATEDAYGVESPFVRVLKQMVYALEGKQIRTLKKVAAQAIREIKKRRKERPFDWDDALATIFFTNPAMRAAAASRK